MCPTASSEFPRLNARLAAALTTAPKAPLLCQGHSGALPLLFLVQISVSCASFKERVKSHARSPGKKRQATLVYRGITT